MLHQMKQRTHKYVKDEKTNTNRTLETKTNKYNKEEHNISYSDKFLFWMLFVVGKNMLLKFVFKIIQRSWCFEKRVDVIPQGSCFPFD